MNGPSLRTPSHHASAIGLVAIVVAASFLAIPGVGLAQTPGAVRGLIVDAEGQAVAGARVVLTDHRDAGNRIRAETSADGRFAYGDLPAGFYTVTADKAELGGEVYRVRVRSGRTVEVNFTLSLGRRPAAWLSDRDEREALSDAFEAGVEASRAGDFETAVERFTQALALRPACVECHFNLAIAYRELSRLDAAEAAFRASLDIDPDYAAAYYGLAALYVELNRLDDAAEARGDATRIARARLAAGRAAAEKAVGEGLVLLDAGNLPDAEQRFRTAIELDVAYGPAYYWFGVTLVGQDRLNGAAEQFERYLSFDPSGEHASDARARLQEARRRDPS